MKMYEVVLKGCGSSWPGWLKYTIKAMSATDAVNKARRQAMEHYLEFGWFEVQSIGEVRT